MEKEIDVQIIKVTQTSLGKYVKRPPLSEKLLKKPPFRFLHDIITNVLKTTGFFEGVFEKEELISENVKDREAKIQFLNKVITVLQYTTGKTINVKPSKIVAGQEVEKTNELLQCLAQALDNNLSSEEAVIKYKNGSKTNVKEVKSKESNKKGTDTKTVRSNSSEHLNNVKKDGKGKMVTKKQKVESTKNEKKSKNVSQNKTVQSHTDPKKNLSGIKINSTDTLVEKKISQSTSSTLEDINVVENIHKEDIYEKSDKKVDETVIDINSSFNKSQSLDITDQSSNSNALNQNDVSSSSSSQNIMGDNTNEIDDVNCKTSGTINNLPSFEDHVSIVNASINISNVNENQQPSRTELKHEIDTLKAEAGPEIIKSKVKEVANQINDNNSFNETVQSPKRSVIQRPFSVRPSSSRPGAPRLREKLECMLPENENIILGKVNIITENNTNEEEDDKSIILADQIEDSLTRDISGDLLSSNDHGHLVQQIMDSQKELSTSSRKTEIDWACGVQKAKETQNQEIDQLKYNIQALSRVANPLGKLLDHVQEDVEVMRQELQQWSNIYDEVTREMQKQKLFNEDSLIPLRTKLKQLDGEISEKQDKMDDLKVIIHKNSTRIEKLLASGNVQ